jgi:hypothetical protein
MGLLSAPLRSVIFGRKLSRDPLYVLAGQVPAEDWQFAKSRSLLGAIRGTPITLTRTTTDQYLNAAGVLTQAAINEAVFPYSPAGTSLGLQVQEARTNALLHSSAISAANWGAVAFLTTATGVSGAPDGSATVSRLIEDSSTSSRYVRQSVAVTNVAWTFSVYAKAAGRRRIMLREASTSGARAVFDLIDGLVVGSGSTGTGAIAFAGNGWWRCSMTYTPSAASSRNHDIHIMSDSATDFATASYAGNGSSDVLLWCAQLEAGTFATSPIPTAGSTVQRTADVATVTGTDFSSWYRQDQGTVYVEAIPVNTANHAFVGCDDGTNNERIRLGNTGTNAQGQIFVVDGNVIQASVSTPIGSAPLDVASKIAGVYAADDFHVCANGIFSVTPDTSGSLPTVTQMTIGTARASVPGGGTISRLVYWPTRLGNSVLQRLTA